MSTDNIVSHFGPRPITDPFLCDHTCTYVRRIQQVWIISIQVGVRGYQDREGGETVRGFRSIYDNSRSYIHAIQYNGFVLL